MKLKYKISFLKRNQNEIDGVRIEYFATNSCNISSCMYSNALAISLAFYLLQVFCNK